MNRLDRETSPYLLQHAENPVHWWPWGVAAIAAARDSDRPLLVSVGYSACHWCHVMAHESFEDEATAAVMNAHFVNVKVDREERPDLDRAFQLAHQFLQRRGGGWPLHVFLDPDDLTPFFAGTYFPPAPRHGLPAFSDLLLRLAEVWRERRAEIRAQNASLREAFGRIQAGDAASEPDARVIGDVIDALAGDYDDRHGGFGGAPKFPQAPLLAFLARQSFTRAESAAGQQAQKLLDGTLRAMASGGLRDHLGGGFYRYTVDGEWTIPHFEKMLYDNAQLLALYAAAAWQTGNRQYRACAEGIVRWLEDEMRAGAFFAAQDADAGGGEGLHYVWTPDEVAAVLEPHEYAVFAARYGLDQPANFEERWHLRLSVGDAELMRRHGLREDELRELLDAARARLLAARRARGAIPRDDKILAGWNGLAIGALAQAGARLGQPDWIALAEEAAAFVHANHRIDGRLHAVHASGRTAVPAFLDDHPFLLDGLLDLLCARWDRRWMAWAVELADALLERFEDREAGGFWFTAHDAEAVVARLKPWSDDATPCGNGVAIRALTRLGHWLGETRYLEAAERALRAGMGQVGQLSYGAATLLDALAIWSDPPPVAVVRDQAERLPEWQAALHPARLPRPDVLLVPDDASDLPGALALRAPRAGGVAYVCRGAQCSAPIGEPAALVQRLTSDAD